MPFLLVAALLSANPVVQPAPVAPAPQAAAAAKPKKVKKICHTEDAASGSHMSKRVCTTQEEPDVGVQSRTADELGTLPTSH